MKLLDAGNFLGQLLQFKRCSGFMIDHGFGTAQNAKKRWHVIFKIKEICKFGKVLTKNISRDSEQL